jgi:hypothetical protein
MRSSWRFALLVLACATVLFLVWPWVSAVYRSLAADIANIARVAGGAHPVTFTREKDSYLLIPALAVIIAAQGYSWRRKAVFIAGAFGGLLAFGALISTFQLGATPVAIPGGSDIAHLPSLLFAVAFPITLVVWFAGSTPSRLWTPGAAEVVAAKCPVCGARKTNLRHHVATAHGPAALKRADVKRALKGERPRAAHPDR